MCDRRNGGRQRYNRYVGAPFNFVPFYNKVVSVKPEQMDVRGSFKKEQLTGEISYTMTAMTPVCIDDGKGNFFVNENNKIAIPGSSVRGLIRNNAQILGLSSFADDIDDYTLMYRDVTGGVDKDYYKEILGADQVSVDGEKVSVLKNVSAGYIACEKGKYYIYKTDVDSLGTDFAHMNYYVISARKILGNLKKYPFFYKNQDCLMYKLGCKLVRVITFKGISDEGRVRKFSYETETDPDGLVKGKEFYYRGTLDGDTIIIEEFSEQPGSRGQKAKCSTNPRVHYVPQDKEKGENDRYIPFFEKVLYKISNDRFVDSIEEFDTKHAKGYREGYLMGTGFIKEKKVLYIIPKINKQKARIEIQEQDIKAYQVDYRKRQSTLVSKIKEPDLKEKLSSKIKEFFSLPEEGEKKPVFYIEPDRNNNIKHLYFGCTPSLRLLYSRSIKEGFHQDTVTYDYARSIFGTAEGKTSGQCDGAGEKETRKAYRSKVSFTDAELKKKVECNEKYMLRLEEPKPSSFYDYIEQQEEVTTYNNDFNLRGVKQYWLAKSLHQLPENAKINQDAGNNQKTEQDCEAYHPFQPLDQGSEFVGSVRFQNLSKEELGLLLWSIRLQNGSCMNIGKAKSYGFGVVAVSDIKVKVVNLEEAYSLDTPLSLNPFRKENMDELINSYKNAINEKLGGKTINQLDHIQDFFAIKNYENLPKQTAIRFMSITNNEGEYRNRQNDRVPLATIQNVLADKQAEAVNRRRRNRSNSSNNAPTEPHAAPKPPERREREPLENECVYIAKITKYQGKKVFFRVDDKGYYNTSIDKIKNIKDLKRETMKDLLPIHSEWSIKKHMDGEQEIWEFEEKGK